MSFRNWLLTGTSLTLLAFAPLGAARAQDATDPALVAAYTAFQAEQNETTQAALTEACIAAGFQSLDDCIAALAQVAPVDTDAQAAADAEAQAAADAQASAEAQAAADAQASAEAQAAADAQASAEAQAAADAQASAEAQAAADAQASAEAQAAADAQASAEAEAAAQAASSEEVAPVSSEEVAPASSEEPAVDVLAQLTAAVDLYNEGVAELDAGNAEGQVKVDTAQGQIDLICSTAGFADTTACLAQFGLVLNPLPPVAEQPAVSSEEAAVSEEPISEMPNADEPVTEEATEVLPETVSPEEAAPIFDSAKDDENAVEEGTTDQPSEEPVVSEEPAAPAPVDDQTAQEDLQAPPPEDQSALTDEGTANADFEFGFAEPPAPEGENVEVVQAPTAENPTFIFKIGINIYINNFQQERDRYYDRDRDEVFYEDLSRGRIRETVERPDGTRIVTVYNRYGDVLKRTKIYPDDREFYLATYDPRDEDEDSFFIDPGDELPPLRLTIPAREYILDADTAEEDEVEFFLDQPPVEKVRRIYSIDEVKRSARLRDSVRRLEVGGLTFDSGKATISRDQVGSLSKVATAMQNLLERNPAEVFLIEGHTDATGGDVPNLVLSDDRAATVARILTEFYEVAPENLVTQGYGERYLKVKTEEAEELNRRVTVKRITPLVTYEAANN